MDWITHEEDVWFDFDGNDPNDLVPGRYYRGEVDGFADFGVFVNIGGVTGLLHRSEVEGRIESLDWDAGDEVFVQVTDVRENGDVDLSWSIRQSPDEFRGHGIHDPDAEGDEVRTVPPEEDESESAPSEGASAGPAGRSPDREGGAGPTETDAEGGEPETADTDAPEASSGDSAGDTSATAEASVQDGPSGTGAEPEADDSAESARRDRRAAEPGPEEATADELEERLEDLVWIEGRVTSIRQTGGPTLFEVRDPTGAVSCAAFEGAGVRAYPGVGEGDLVRIEGRVEVHRGSAQIETADLEVLSGEDAEDLAERIEAAATDAARPPDVEPLAGDVIAPIDDAIEAAATAVRRAVFDGRRVVIRHRETVDATVGGVALELAVEALLDEEYGDDVAHNALHRSPVEETYDTGAAVHDVDADGEPPLVALVGLHDVGEGLDVIGAYDVETVAIAGVPIAGVGDRPDASADPDAPQAIADGEGEATVTAVAPASLDDRLPDAPVASEVAVRVAPDVRGRIAPLPAIGPRSPPTTYLDVAADAGVDRDAVETRREATAIATFHHRRSGKREFLRDVLLGADGVAERLSGQYADRMDDALSVATANAFDAPTDAGPVRVLDADAYTDRFSFPPARILVDALHESGGADDTADDPVATILAAEHELHLRSEVPIDARDHANEVRETTDLHVRAVGGPDGRVTFPPGERDDVIDAAVAWLGERAS